MLKKYWNWSCISKDKNEEEKHFQNSPLDIQYIYSSEKNQTTLSKHFWKLKNKGNSMEYIEKVEYSKLLW